ncbi:hypothetical protein swp_3751 [Shewanella piezotolerans WP3]|uniref:Uncharacterized protein n=1 Tax=Shewanella piezotolerans (strain WP3 / JCM 13877) TaxID=225849 RepID=B8CSE3_SHEPW|nr:hypothetical protein swp_3751 [Shewanella piezotolerans WP3]
MLTELLFNLEVSTPKLSLLLLMAIFSIKQQ